MVAMILVPAEAEKNIKIVMAGNPKYKRDLHNTKVMLRFVFLLVIIFLFYANVYAQMKSDTLANGIIIVKDIRYDSLSRKKAEINKKATIARTPVRGYRLQIINSTSRTEALDAKSKMLSLYPQHKLYLLYQAPYFKLRMGNFKEYAQAAVLKKEINDFFPKGITVIPSNIEYKQEQEDLVSPSAQP
ncbi:MAG: hypothetical protein ACK5XN_30270 [Bacteroidota bacterium]